MACPSFKCCYTSMVDDRASLGNVYDECKSTFNCLLIKPTASDDMSEMYNGHLEPAATKIMVKSPKRASAAKKTSVSPKKKKLKKKKIKKIRSDDGGGEGKEEEKEEGKEGTGGEKRESDDKSETGDKTGEDEGNEEEEGEEDDDDDEEEIKFVGEERKICLAPADEGQQELSPTRMSFLGV